MTAFLQSVFAFVLGLTLAFFGLVHSISKYPGSAAFSEFTALLPALGSVLFFVIGVIACLAGMVMLVISGKQLRHRWKFVRRTTDRRVHQQHARYRDEMYAEQYEGNGRY